MRASKLLILLVIAIGFPSVVKGSACVQEKYHLFISTQYKYYETDHFWNKDGSKKSAQNTFTKQEGELYIEFGLTQCDTLSAKGSWARIQETMNGRTFGFSDIELGWKHSLGEQCNHLIAVEGILIVPPEDTYAPGLRYGEWGGELDLLATRAFCICDRPAWYDLGLGYRWYSGFPSDQIRAEAILTYQPFSKLYLTTGAYLEYGVWNGKSRIDQSFILFNPNYRLLKANVEATYLVYEGASIVAGYNQHVWGRNVGTGGQVYGGLQIQF